jgi:hypothetical protein
MSTHAYPPGCYSLWKVSNGTDLSALCPQVPGLFLQLIWGAIEPQVGSFAWRNKVDPIVGAARRQGKAVVLSLGTGAGQCPTWLMNRVASISLVDTNPNHTTYGQAVACPLPWDDAFLACKALFYQAAGNRYAGDATVVGATGSFCACGTGDDWGVPCATGTYNFGSGPVQLDQVAQWDAVGYSTARMLGAASSCLDSLAAACPQQYIGMAMGWALATAKLDAGMGIGDSTLAQKVIAYGFGAPYGGRFLPQYNRLATSTPAASDAGVTGATAGSRYDLFRTFASLGGRLGWQMAVACGDAATLDACSAIGESYASRFYQLWTADATNPALFPSDSQSR